MAVTVAAGSAAVTMVRSTPAPRHEVRGESVSEAYSSTMLIVVGEYPASVLPGLPGWAVAASAAVLVTHLIMLGRRPAVGHGFPGRTGPRDLAGLGLVGIAAAVLVLGTSPWWLEWTSVPFADAPWTAFRWEPSWWWSVGVVLGVTGSALGVWAVRGVPARVDGGPRRTLRPGTDVAAVTSWTGAAVLAAHAVWGLALMDDLWVPVAVCALLVAQAVMLDLTHRTGTTGAADR